jgi:hypothetical protein
MILDPRKPWPFPMHNGQPVKQPKPPKFNPYSAPDAPF